MDKLINVINSCETLEQLVCAERYACLFKQRYGITDDYTFNEKIKRHIFIKNMKLKNGWNNKD